MPVTRKRVGGATRVPWPDFRKAALFRSGDVRAEKKSVALNFRADGRGESELGKHRTESRGRARSKGRERIPAEKRKSNARSRELRMPDTERRTV